MCSHINTRGVGWNLWTGKDCWASTVVESLQLTPSEERQNFPTHRRAESKKKNKHEWTKSPHWDCNAVWSPTDRQSSSSRLTFVSEWRSGLVELCKSASLQGQLIGYGLGSCDHDCVSPPVSELSSPWLTWLGETWWKFFWAWLVCCREHHYLIVPLWEPLSSVWLLH